MKTASLSELHAPFTQTSQALESVRDAGYDLSAAAGEPTDNAIQAKASQIRIDFRKDESGGVREMAFADNGIGIAPDVLVNVLSLGYSTRYGARKGIGRFGMGLKLASLSQARKIDVYSRPLGSSTIYHTWLDLDDVSNGNQQDLTIDAVESWPTEFAHLMEDAKTGQSYENGTLVVWGKIDRLHHGGRFNESVHQKIAELRYFLARAYRMFINDGVYVELEGKPVHLHDPLFLLENPRVTEQLKLDVRGVTVDSGTLKLDGQEVDWVVTVLPQEFRQKQGEGGRDFKELHVIRDNQGRISMVREKREIYFDIVPRLFPTRIEDIDRFIGIQVSFPATLDDYFQVRHVKRGAEPVFKLREALKLALEKPIREARKQIRKHWKAVERAESQKAGTDGHDSATAAAAAADETSPKGVAGVGAGEDDVAKQLRQLMEDLGLDLSKEEDRRKAEEIRGRYEKQPLSIADGGWPGKEFMDIVHLSGKAIVKVNHRHPFISEIYDAVKAVLKADPAELTVDRLLEVLRHVDIGLDLLLLAYAKAENLERNPDEKYGELRSFWGIFAAAYTREALKRES